MSAVSLGDAEGDGEGEGEPAGDAEGEVATHPRGGGGTPALRANELRVS